MMIHFLKTFPEFFEATLSGEKRFEVRHSYCRKFEKGNVLCLQEFTEGRYTGRVYWARVIALWLLPTELAPGPLCGMQIEPLSWLDLDELTPARGKA